VNASTRGFRRSKIKARLTDLGGTVLPGSPSDFAKLIADETEKWGKVVKFAGPAKGSPAAARAIWSSPSR
jgi:hypothetical protein